MAFAYKDTVTVTGNSALLPSTQTDFPVLYSVTDNALKTTGNGGQVTSSSGYDVRPYSDSGLTSALSFELESYDGTAGTIRMWVKIPSLALSGTFYVGIGDAGITTNGSSTGTWKSAFKMVHHYGDGSTISYEDSTSNNRDGSASNSPAAATGKIYGGVSMDADNDGISIGSTAIPTTGSWSGWIYPTWAYNDSQIHAVGINWLFAGDIFHAIKYDDNNFYVGWYNGTDGRVSTSASGLSQNAWNHIALTWDSAAPATKLYLNGAQIGSTNTTNATEDTSTATAYVGYSPQDSKSMANGSLDEFRLLDAVLTADWIKAEYNAANDPSAFLSHNFAANGSARFFLLGGH